MKLRNKKTGEIVEYDKIGFRKGLSDGWKDFVPNAESIAELNEEWEDYKPTEPLIKDPKIRKAVRAWAEINNFEPDYSVMYEAGIFGLTSYQADIEFNFPLKELEGGKDYTISELCGSEE